MAFVEYPKMIYNNANPKGIIVNNKEEEAKLNNAPVKETKKAADWGNK